VNHQRYTLESLPRKVVNFIKRRDQGTQERINAALEYIVRTPFRHENPTIIKRLRGTKTERYRYRIGTFVSFTESIGRKERSVLYKWTIVVIFISGFYYSQFDILSCEPTLMHVAEYT